MTKSRMYGLTSSGRQRVSVGDVRRRCGAFWRIAGFSEEDCRFVEFSINPRGRLDFGLCFLRIELAVGRVWSGYKCHPALLCTVQNDDFVERSRDLSDLKQTARLNRKVPGLRDTPRDNGRQSGNSWQTPLR